MANSKERQAVASLIAHYAMAADLSENVPGFTGFLEFWKKELSARDRALLNFFDQEMKDAPARLAAMLDLHQKGKG